MKNKLKLKKKHIRNDSFSLNHDICHFSAFFIGNKVSNGPTVNKVADILKKLQIGDLIKKIWVQSVCWIIQ